jgi:uncharacterized protein YndB with AHSA1/START domain
VNNKQIVKSAIVAADINQVWQKWTTHEGLKTFFGVDNMIELRPGGPYEIYFLLENPPGTRGGEGNQVLSFLPREMLSFSWNAPPSIPEIRNHAHRTWVVVVFRELGPLKTEVTLKHVGWLDGEKWDETIAYFEKAWDIVLNSLQASCQA